tara:strand:- start:447 stop:1163 length:717 start_codon:yes stop_codon:yes gene_type:complete
MARKQGLRPIGESLRPIIDRIKKEREEKRRKNKPIRTQPKLPGMKKGGSTEPKYTVEDEVKSRMRKETPKTGYGIGLSPVTQMRRYLHRKRIKKERARDDAKVNKKAKGGSMENPKKVDRIVGRLKDKDRSFEKDVSRARRVMAKAAGVGALGAVPGVAAGLGKLGRSAQGRKNKDPNKDKRSPGRPGGKGKKEDKRRKIRYMTPVAKKAQGGIAFGGEKRIPGSGAAFRGTGFKGIF